MVQGREIRAGSASFVGADADESASGSRVYIKTGEECPGYFFVGSRLREGWDEVAKKLGLTYDLHLISGDSPDASRQVAKWFGEGKSHFGLSPSGKKEYIERLKNEGRQVLMVGDGLNDAGALASGRVGISVADNIYHFTPASDAILEAASFSSFARFMGFARDNLRIIRISMGISVVYNIAGLYFAVQGLLTPVLAAILMPASLVTVVAFTTLATNYLSGKWLGKSSAEGKNAATN